MQYFKSDNGASIPIIERIASLNTRVVNSLRIVSSYGDDYFDEGFVNESSDVNYDAMFSDIINFKEYFDDLITIQRSINFRDENDIAEKYALIQRVMLAQQQKVKTKVFIIGNVKYTVSIYLELENHPTTENAVDKDAPQYFRCRTVVTENNQQISDAVYTFSKFYIRYSVGSSTDGVDIGYNTSTGLRMIYFHISGYKMYNVNFASTILQLVNSADKQYVLPIVIIKERNTNKYRTLGVNGGYPYGINVISSGSSDNAITNADERISDGEQLATTRKGDPDPNMLISEDVGIPDLPQSNALASGFVTAYVMDSTALNGLSTWLWDDSLLAQLQKARYSPFDTIVSFKSLPIDLQGATTTLKLGGMTSNISCQKMSTQFVELNLGSLAINECSANFTDYNPYTSVTIHLPYIGNRSLDTDIVMGSLLTLKYHVDVLSGRCLAFLHVKKNDGSFNSVAYAFEGSLSENIPLAKQTDNTLTSMVGGIITSGGTPSGLMSSVTNTINAKQQVSSVTTYSENVGVMSVRTAYVTIKIPKVQKPKHLQNVKGFITNLSNKISTFTGFTQFSDVSISVNASLSEQEEIISLLKSGVIL